MSFHVRSELKISLQNGWAKLALVSFVNNDLKMTNGLFLGYFKFLSNSEWIKLNQVLSILYIILKVFRVT
jgi:hypothetical protein